MAKVMYAENGLQYTVTVPEFTGYIYQSADRALEGVIGADEDAVSYTHLDVYKRQDLRIQGRRRIAEYHERDAPF